MNEWINEWMNEWMNESINDHFLFPILIHTFSFISPPSCSKAETPWVVARQKSTRGKWVWYLLRFSVLLATWFRPLPAKSWGKTIEAVKTFRRHSGCFTSPLPRPRHLRHLRRPWAEEEDWAAEDSSPERKPFTKSSGLKRRLWRLLGDRRGVWEAEAVEEAVDELIEENQPERKSDDDKVEIIIFVLKEAKE